MMSNRQATTAAQNQNAELDDDTLVPTTSASSNTAAANIKESTINRNNQQQQIQQQQQQQQQTQQLIRASIFTIQNDQQRQSTAVIGNTTTPHALQRQRSIIEAATISPTQIQTPTTTDIKENNNLFCFMLDNFIFVEDEFNQQQSNGESFNSAINLENFQTYLWKVSYNLCYLIIFSVLLLQLS
jgi:hypothetical protein